MVSTRFVRLRCVVVSALSCALLGAVLLLCLTAGLDAAHRLGRSPDSLLVLASAALGAGAAAVVLCLVLAGVRDAWQGRAPVDAGLVRRWVGAGCGVGLGLTVALTSTSAFASGASGGPEGGRAPQSISGLPLPEQPVDPAPGAPDGGADTTQGATGTDRSPSAIPSPGARAAAEVSSAPRPAPPFASTTVPSAPGAIPTAQGSESPTRTGTNEAEHPASSPTATSTPRATPARRDTASAGPERSPAGAPGDAESHDVVVQPGDTLWHLARAELLRAGAPASNSAVAARWHAWFQLNRTVIGPDPDLLHPGTRLQRPAPLPLLAPGDSTVPASLSDQPSHHEES